MGAKPLVIVGAGGFGRETLDVVRASDPYESEWDFVGFVSESKPESELLDRIGASWIGAVDQFLSSRKDVYYTLAIGDPKTRRLISKKFEGLALPAATLIHPSATLGADVQIGAGSVVCSNVSITTNVRIGRHVHLNLNSTVGHDVRIADFVSVNPLVAISGAVTIGEGCQLGTHSAILQGLTIGPRAIVGAGSVVTKDVNPEQTVIGIPARPMLKSPE